MRRSRLARWLPVLMGGGATWLPSDLDGLVLWLDASDLTGDDGDAIASWVSKEGNSYDFAQTTAEKKPLLKKAANGINNKNAVRFDGADDLLVLGSAALTSSKGTVVAVYRLSETPSSYQHVLSSADEGSTTKYVRFHAFIDDATAYMGAEVRGATNNVLRGDAVLFSNVPYISVWQSSDTGYFAFVNGAAQVLTVTTGADNGNWFGDVADRDNTVVGALKRTTEAAFMKGDVSEIIVYNDALTEGNLSLLNQYLSSKYGIPLSESSAAVEAEAWGVLGTGEVESYDAFDVYVATLSNESGGTITIPAGTYKVSSDVYWASNVNLTGAGIGESVIKLYAGAAFMYSGSAEDVLTNCDFTDFEVDGSEQTVADTSTKGFYFKYCSDINFTRVSVHDVAATGFGNDFMVSCTYTGCVANDNGRLGTTASSGCSGFGIGTGVYETEDVILTNCTATGNKRYGVFFEKQFDTGDGYLSTGMQIIGGQYNENNWGVGDCGVDGLVIDGAEINSNTAVGLIVNGPSLYNIAGVNGNVSNCEIAYNGDGIDPDEPATYTLTDNNVHDNLS